ALDLAVGELLGIGRSHDPGFLGDDLIDLEEGGIETVHLELDSAVADDVALERGGLGDGGIAGLSAIAAVHGRLRLRLGDRELLALPFGAGALLLLVPSVNVVVLYVEYAKGEKTGIVGLLRFGLALAVSVVVHFAHPG